MDNNSNVTVETDTKRDVKLNNSINYENHFGIKPHIIRRRLKLGWNEEEAKNTPLKCQNGISKEMEGCSKSAITKYYKLRKKGYSYEEALKEAKKSKICKDHLGQEFENINAMCKYYGITRKLYGARISKQKWELAKVLTEPKCQIGGFKHGKKCTDHLGKEYRSEEERAKAYGKKGQAVRVRLKNKWSLEDALTVDIDDVRECDKVIDHQGNKFNSVKAAAEYHGTTESIYGALLKSGKLNENYKFEHKASIVEDHLGNIYKSQAEMCIKYKISTSAFCNRIGLNWSLEEILTTPIGAPRKSKKNTVDHVGNEFKSEEKRAETYGLTSQCIRFRQKKGMTLRESLITPSERGNNKNIEINDTSLNRLISIHEYSHTGDDKERYFRVTVVEDGSEKYMNENQIIKYPEGWDL